MGKKILIVVDVQHDFCHPDGALFVPNGDVVKDRIKNIIPEFDFVVFTKDSHPINHCSFTSQGGRWPIHCVSNTTGAGIPVELFLAAKDYAIVSKGGASDVEEYGAFNEDEYELECAICWAFDNYEQSSELFDKTYEIVICGMAGDYCVLETLKNVMKYFPHKDRIKVYLDGVASTDGGFEITEYVMDKNITIYNE